MMLNNISRNDCGVISTMMIIYIIDFVNVRSLTPTINLKGNGIIKNIINDWDMTVMVDTNGNRGLRLTSMVVKGYTTFMVYAAIKMTPDGWGWLRMVNGGLYSKGNGWYEGWSILLIVANHGWDWLSLAFTINIIDRGSYEWCSVLLNDASTYAENMLIVNNIVLSQCLLIWIGALNCWR